MRPPIVMCSFPYRSRFLGSLLSELRSVALDRKPGANAEVCALRVFVYDDVGEVLQRPVRGRRLRKISRVSDVVRMRLRRRRICPPFVIFAERAITHSIGIHEV